MGNFRGRELLRIGESDHFTAKTFMEKTSTGGSQTVEFVSFLPRKFFAIQYVTARVDNEGEYQTHYICGLCKIFSESHLQKIKVLISQGA